MSKNILVILYIFFIFLISSIPAVQIYKNSFKHHEGWEIDYYHLEFVLKKDNFTIIIPEEWKRCYKCLDWDNRKKSEDKDYEIKSPCTCRIDGFSKSGAFEIYIDKNKFPLNAPNCKSKWLPLRMAGSSLTKNFKSEVGIKKDLWEKIYSVSNGDLDSVKVVIELNPYYTVLEEEPIKLGLCYCEMKFRTFFGAYVNHTMSIENKD